MILRFNIIILQLAIFIGHIFVNIVDLLCLFFIYWIEYIRSVRIRDSEILQYFNILQYIYLLYKNDKTIHTIYMNEHIIV